MEKLNSAIILLFCTVALNAQKNWTLISKLKYGNTNLELKKAQTKRIYRVNADGTRFFKTSLAMIIQLKEKEEQVILPDYFYSADNNDGFSTPCMIINPENNTICIFVLEKNEEEATHGMTGYAYFYSETDKRFYKETVFSRLNQGWYSFYGGIENGNPVLCHFSYDGYYAQESKRNSNGTWSNFRVGSLKPDVAANQYKNHKNILICNSRIDRMTGLTTECSASDGTSSNSSTLTSDEGTIIGIGLFLLGVKALWNYTTTYSSGESYSSGSENSNSYNSGSGNSSSDSRLSTGQSTSRNTVCYSDAKEISTAYVSCDDSKYGKSSIYELKCGNGKIEMYYIISRNQSEGLCIKQKGYYDYTTLGKGFLGDDYSKSMKKLCNCD